MEKPKAKEKVKETEEEKEKATVNSKVMIHGTPKTLAKATKTQMRATEVNDNTSHAADAARWGHIARNGPQKLLVVSAGGFRHQLLHRPKLGHFSRPPPSRGVGDALDAVNEAWIVAMLTVIFWSTVVR